MRKLQEYDIDDHKVFHWRKQKLIREWERNGLQ